MEPCSFQILKLLVTDDINVIKQAFDLMLAKNKTLEHSPIPAEREKFKQIFGANSDLKNENTRRAIIEFHTDAFREYVEQFIGGRTEDITRENYNFLLKQGQGATYHLSPELVEKILNDGLSVWGINVIDMTGPKRSKPTPPALVTDLVISVEHGFPRLRWKLPDKGCGRVRVLAKNGAFPSNDKDGREVFNGLGAECLDEKAKPASTCYYAIFSYSDGQSSSPASTKGQHFFAVGVDGLKAERGLEQIKIRWQQPTFKYDSIVVFRARAGHLHIDYRKNQFPSPGKTTPDEDKTTFRRVYKSNQLVEDRQPDGDVPGIVPGEPYDHMIFVDYGLIGQRHEFSSGQFVPAVTAVPAAKPVRNPQFRSTEEGLLLTWERPKHLCDKIIVVRSIDDEFPKDVNDGKDVTLDHDNIYLDTGLVAGTTYYYSIFSVYQGYASACVTANKLYAGPALNFRPTDPVGNPGHIGLSWALPKNTKALKLFRRKNNNPETRWDKGEWKNAKGEEQIPLRGTPTSFPDKVDAGVKYCYSLHVLYDSDSEWSPPAFACSEALEPSRKVGVVRAAVTPTGNVELEWSSPDPGKANIYQYQVWRRKKPIAGTGALGKQNIGTAKENKFEDSANARDPDSPIPGTWYQYAVQAVVGKVDADMSEWAGVFVTSDVVRLSTIGMNGIVLLKWTPPPNAKRILIQRQDGAVVPSAPDLSHAIDTAVTNGKTYIYTVKAVFQDATGKEFYSRGVSISATPISPAEPVQNLRVRYEHGVVKVSWDLPPSSRDGIRVSRLEAPPAFQVGDIFDVPTILSSKRHSGHAVLYEDKSAKIGNVYYYAVYALRGATATFCGCVEAPLLGEVQSLSARNQRSEIWLQWKWPDGIEIVRVLRKKASSAGEMVKVCTRGQYGALGFFVDKIPAKPDQYIYQIRSVRSEGEERLESLLSAEVTVVGGELPRITYAVRKRKSEVEVKCNLPDVGVKFCGLVLVRNNSRDPLYPDDGEIVDRFRPNGKSPPKVVMLRDKRVPGRGYYKVFLAEPDRKKQMVDLINPPLSERKV